MNIDLVYYFREVNHFYYLNGPEKVNGNIVNNSPAYQLTSANDVVIKINQMIASLAPDITNVGIVTSELYTGDIQVNTYRGELNVSSVPDYTSILTSINTNLTNLNSKFVSNVNSNSNLSISDLISKICQYTNGSSCFTIPNSFLSNNEERNRSNIPYLILNLIRMFYSDNITIGTSPAQNNKLFEVIKNQLKQSVSPNASITDVISSLNTNIHNDLTNINTTENNKDTVLIIDGQQEFKLHKDDE